MSDFEISLHSKVVSFHPKLAFRTHITSDQGFRIQPTFASNQMNSNNQIMNQYGFPGAMAGGIERERMIHMGNFRPPPPAMMNESSGFHQLHIDPAHAYIERMHAMAHMNGFNSMEDMMIFQQNMMTNMMAGAPMEMQMRGPGSLVAHARGQFPPYQAGDPSQFQRCVKHICVIRDTSPIALRNPECITFAA